MNRKPRTIRLLSLFLALLLSACGVQEASSPSEQTQRPAQSPSVQSKPSPAVVPQTTQSPQEQTGFSYWITGSSQLPDAADSMFFLGDELFLTAVSDSGDRVAYRMQQSSAEDGADSTAEQFAPEGMTGSVLAIVPGDGVLWYCTKTDGGIVMTSVSPEGRVIGKTPLQNSETRYPYSVAVDGDGCFYLLDVDSLKIYSGSGVCIADFPMKGEQGIGLVTLGGGQVLLSTRAIQNGGMPEGAVKLVNTESISTSLTDRTVTYRVYRGWDNLALLSDGGGLYTLDIQTGEMTAVLDWIDTYQDPSTLVAVGANSPEQIYLISGEEEALKLRHLDRVPAEPETKTVINLGYYLKSEAQASVLNSLTVAYNSSQDDVRVHVVNYNNYTDGDERLRADAGDLDLIFSGSDNLDGMDLLDLRELLDSEVGQETLMPCVYQALGEHEISSLPLCFQVMTLVGNKEILGEAEQWTPEEFSKAVGEHSDAAVLQFDTAYDSLSSMVLLAGAYITDYASMLSAFQSAPKDEESVYARKANSSSSAVGCLKDGSLLLSQLSISGFSDLLSWEAAMEGNLVLKGYPVNQGNGGLIRLSPQSRLAIPSASAHPQEAWSFLKRILSDQTMHQLDSSEFPILKTDFSDLEEEAMQGISFTDADGNTVITGGTVVLDGTNYEIEPLSAEKADWFRDYLNGLSGPAGENSELSAKAKDALRSVIEDGADPATASGSIKE